MLFGYRSLKNISVTEFSANDAIVMLKLMLTKLRQIFAKMLENETTIEICNCVCQFYEMQCVLTFLKPKQVRHYSNH